MKTHFRKEFPGSFFITITLFITLALNACSFTVLHPTSPKITITPAIKTPNAITETGTPTQDGANSACYFNWARETLPELSKEFDEALKEIQPQAKGYAEAYGEDCINQDNEVVYFVAMETDFYVTFTVEDLEDKQALGELVEQVFAVMAAFPVEDIPGPQPGYVGITFEAPEDSTRLWVTRTEIEVALENGFRGEELLNTLQTK